MSEHTPFNTETQTAQVSVFTDENLNAIQLYPPETILPYDPNAVLSPEMGRYNPSLEETPSHPEAVNPKRTAFRGLVRFIAGDKELAQNDVQEIERSQGVRREVADAYRTTPVLTYDTSPSTKDYKETFKPRDRYTPQTRSEIRQVAKLGRKQTAANDIRSGKQYRLRRSYGDDIGEDGYEDRIRRSNKPRSFKKHALKAHKEFLKSEDRALHLDSYMNRAAEGRDRKNRSLQRNINRNIRESDGNLKRQKLARATKDFVRPLPGYVIDDIQKAQRATSNWLEDRKNKARSRRSRGTS